MMHRSKSTLSPCHRRMLELFFIVVVFLTHFISSQSLSMNLGNGFPSSGNHQNHFVHLPMLTFTTISSMSSIRTKVVTKWHTFQEKLQKRRKQKQQNGQEQSSESDLTVVSSVEESSSTNQTSSESIDVATDHAGMHPNSLDSENSLELNQRVKMGELQQALVNARQFTINQNGKGQLTATDIISKGWKSVFESKEFSLFKRRVKRSDGSDGPVEYLMTGSIPDISPFSFLAAQIHRSWRAIWDNTMKDMSTDNIFILRNYTKTVSFQANHVSNLVEGSQNITSVTEPQMMTQSVELGCHIPAQESSDILYYRTKWPWPLKDRDYTLARRCHIFPKENAFVFVSRSTEANDIPSVNGVIRVDNYWCHSVVFSLHDATDDSTDESYSSSALSALESTASSSSSSSKESMGDDNALVGTKGAASSSFWGNLIGRRKPNPRVFAEQQWQNMVALQRKHALAMKHIDFKRKQSLNQRRHIKWTLKTKMLARRVMELQAMLDGTHPVLGTMRTSAAASSVRGGQQPRPLNLEASLDTFDDNDEDDEDGGQNTLRSQEGDGASSSNNGDSELAQLRAERNSLHRRGLCFVTIFCDDQKMPLHPRLVDILSSAGEKVVPESIGKLCEIARKMDGDQDIARKNQQLPQQQPQEQQFAQQMHIPLRDAGIAP